MRHKQKKKMMSEINVVPYIDVMLVLLVIFMVTAPLLTQGVKVDLPQAQTKTVEPEEREPVIISVTKEGQYFLNDQQLNSEELKKKVAIVLRVEPKTPIYVRGDKRVDYGSVVGAMALLQAAGAPSIGLITTPETDRKKK